MNDFYKFFSTLKGIQIKFFTVDQNVWKSVKCILTKFEFFTSCHFQDIVVQSQQFSSSTSQFFQYCDKRSTFGKLAWIF